MFTRSMTVNPKTMKRNCSSPGTRFDFSLKSTSNTTMYRIVPAARPTRNIFLSNTRVLMVNSSSLITTDWHLIELRILPCSTLITMWCWCDASIRVLSLTLLVTPDSSLMPIPIAIPIHHQFKRVIKITKNKICYKTLAKQIIQLYY